MIILRTFNNKLALKYPGLELVKDTEHGYFYWYSSENASEQMHFYVNTRQVQGEYVFLFSHLTEEQWFDRADSFMSDFSKVNEEKAH
jgi:hypothetical protein